MSDYLPPKLARLQVSSALLAEVRKKLAAWGDWVGGSQHVGSAHWSEVLEKLGYIERPAPAASCPGDADDVPLSVDAAVGALGLLDAKAQWVVLVNYTMPGTQGNKSNVAGMSTARFKAILHGGELFVAAVLLQKGVVANVQSKAA